MENAGNRRLVVLCAEDDPDDQLLIKEAWDECKIINSLIIVNDGVELMEYLRREGKYSDNNKYPMPGLILLDINMPRKGGKEVMEEIEKDESLKSIPVVVLTTSKAEEDIVRLYNLGISSFITKPVSFEGLVKVFDTVDKYWFEIVSVPKKNKV